MGGYRQLWERENHEAWEEMKIIVTIRAKNPEMAEKLVQWGFDNTMSFEDKSIFRPKVEKVIE